MELLAISIIHFQNIGCVKKLFQGLHFMFDQAPFHVTQRSDATFAISSIDVKWFPKRMTPFLQPVGRPILDETTQVAVTKKVKQLDENGTKSLHSG